MDAVMRKGGRGEKRRERERGRNEEGLEEREAREVQEDSG